MPLLESLAQAERPEHGVQAGGPAMSEAGHRARLRARLLEAGPIAVADHELVEMVLFLGLPRRDTKPIARALISRFGSFASAISAPPQELLGVDGLGEAGVAALKIVQAAAQRLAKAEVLYRPVLGNWDRLMEYLQSVLSREKIEQFRILFLDKKNGLIADEVQGLGTVDHTPVYPREVMRRALELSATAIVLVHNHPSGDPTPSTQDIKMTLDIIAIAKSLGVAVHDHIIVGRNGHASLKGMRLI